MLIQVLPERLLCRVRDALDHQIECILRRADGAHAVVNTARPMYAVSALVFCDGTAKYTHPRRP